LEGSPIYTRVQRLTNRQWENAVTDILRFKAPHDLSASFMQPILGTTEFDNNELILDVNSRSFVDFETGAEAAAASATGSAEALAALAAGSDSSTFVSTFGRRAFRRPLTAEEWTKFETVFARGEQLYGTGFANGAVLVIRAMLESPHFLYRTELGPTGDPLNAYELASKLSFWLLGTTPSDSLLDAADAGTLSSDAGLEAAARQMLDDPRATEVMRDFHGQLLRLDRLRDVSKVGVPEYDPAINSELESSSYAFFDLIFQQNLGVREILTSRQGYVGPGLAPLYGLDARSNGLELRDLGPTRSGYFMQVPFLLLQGWNDNPNSIQRGFELERTMVCRPAIADLNIPPPLPPLVSGETHRQRVSEFTATCGGTCHKVYINPLGFAFEDFDGMGRERSTDNGQPVDTTGSYPFAEGVASFADGNELMQVMAESAQVHTCFSKHIAGYALGRDLVESDRPLLESLAKVSLAESLKEVALALVRDPAFRIRKAGQP
jgi:hypothetical protein